jgi:septin family protein
MAKLTFTSIYTDSMSQSERDARRARYIRDKIGRFRILVIGRANAGKTTILQKVCNTTEQPVIHTASGEMVRNLSMSLGESSRADADHSRFAVRSRRQS